MFGIFIQVLIAIIIVVVLFVIGFSVFNMEMIKSIQNAGKLKRVVPVFTGVKDFAFVNSGETYNTSDPANPTYINLTPSYNQRGGIEYSYNFWLYIDRTAMGATGAVAQTMQQRPDQGLKATDNILFVRGSNRGTVYKSICGTDKKDILVKSPLIKFERENMDVLTVEFNTVAAPDPVKQGTRNRCNDTASVEWESMNSHKISLADFSKINNMDSKWFMVTVVLQDTNPSDVLPIRNSARCQIYVNGVLKLDQYVKGRLSDSVIDAPSVMRTNAGNLYIYPKVDIPGSSPVQSTNSMLSGSGGKAQAFLMADLTYYNYVLEKGDIADLFNRGFSKKTALSVNSIAEGNSLTSIYDNMSILPQKNELRTF